MQSLWQKPQLRKRVYEAKLEDHYRPKSRTVYTGPHYGLELEVENAVAFKFSDDLAKYWTTHEDQSLHNSGLELVAVRPLKVEDLDPALAALDATLGLNPKFDYSDRASFHLHINVRDWTMKQWHIFSTIFYLIEDALVLRSGGPKREGNRFCLRLRDAQHIITKFKKFYTHRDFMDIMNIERYANLNHQAFDKFGTLEIRCHRSTRNVKEYASFIKAVQAIEAYSKEVTDVRHIFQELSYSGYAQWVEQKMPDLYKYLLGGDPLKLTRTAVAEFVAKSLPLAQEIGLGFDLIEEEEKKPPKKVREESGSLTWGLSPNSFEQPFRAPPVSEEGLARGLSEAQLALVRSVRLGRNAPVRDNF